METLGRAGVPIGPSQEAVRRGLKVAGTLSVLDEADQAGLVIFDNANQ